MIIGPHEIARRIQYQHRPGWVVWYGQWTRQYWALATWVRTPHCMLSAGTPEAIEAAIKGFEWLHPKLGQHAHAVDH